MRGMFQTFIIQQTYGHLGYPSIAGSLKFHVVSLELGSRGQSNVALIRDLGLGERDLRTCLVLPR